MLDGKDSLLQGVDELLGRIEGKAPDGTDTSEVSIDFMEGDDLPGWLASLLDDEHIEQTAGKLGMPLQIEAAKNSQLATKKPQRPMWYKLDDAGQAVPCSFEEAMDYMADPKRCEVASSRLRIGPRGQIIEIFTRFDGLDMALCGAPRLWHVGVASYHPLFHGMQWWCETREDATTLHYKIVSHILAWSRKRHRKHSPRRAMVAHQRLMATWNGYETHRSF